MSEGERQEWREHKRIYFYRYTRMKKQ